MLQSVLEVAESIVSTKNTAQTFSGDDVVNWTSDV
jgi:hypothetical protein